MDNSNRSSMATVRLTVGQAIVKYLQVQYSEVDGVQQRLNVYRDSLANCQPRQDLGDHQDPASRGVIA
jgi:hypothetical protein